MKKLLQSITLLFTTFVFSQENLTVAYADTPLKQVLLDVQNKTALSFSYAEEVIKDKKINFTDSDITAAVLLGALADQTGLVFEKISETLVIISVPVTKLDVCGYLFDSESNTPLPYATVLVKGTSMGASTDETGFFQLEDVEEAAKLIIQYVGYADQTVEASAYGTTNCKNIYLRPKAQSLQEVVVLGYLNKGLDKTMDGSFILKNTSLGILPGLVEPDVFQSIQMIPGITSLDESASGIQIRGGSPDQNLIYFDGIKMYNTGHFFGMISTINPYVTESVKIYKGGASPKYGDRISGVIDISSATQVSDTVYAGIGVNGTHADAFLKTPLGKNAGLVLSGRRSYTDALQTPTFDALAEKVFQNTKIVTDFGGQVVEDDDDASEIVGDENFFFYDANGKLILEPSNNDRITIGGLLTRNDLDFSSSDDEDLTQDLLIIENQGASFSWQGTRWGKFQHSLKAYYSHFDSDYNNTVSEDLLVEEENLRKNTVEDYGMDLNISYDFLPHQNIMLGYQYSNSDVFFQLFRDEAGDADIEPGDDDEIPLPSETRDFNEIRQNVNQANTVYAEYRYQPANKGFVSLGARASHYSLVDDFFLEPRLNVEYPITDKLRLKVTAERRYQPISQLIEFEDTQLRLENNIWTLSDGNDIPVLESSQFSGGFLLNVDDWTLDIDGYFKKIKGLTSFTNGFTNAAEELSQGESDIVGLDVLLRKKIGSYRIWLGYTFNDVEYRFEELQSNPFPGNNDVTHNFRIANTYETGNWQFSVGWNYRTGLPFTPVDSFSTITGDIDFGPVNSERLPNYHRLDASLIYKFGISTSGRTKATFGVSLQNVYSRQVPISIFYRVDQDPNTGLDELNQIEQLSLGFTPNATFRLYF
ncbi:TonB-dependent receptor [Flavobacteriaceae bacterium 3-367]